MGPRLFSRGNAENAGGVPADLQVASMGPRLFSRGNMISDMTTADAPAASMGPRLFSRGNGVSVDELKEKIGFNGATTFQPWKCPGAF